MKSKCVVGLKEGELRFSPSFKFGVDKIKNRLVFVVGIDYSLILYRLTVKRDALIEPD